MSANTLTSLTYLELINRVLLNAAEQPVRQVDETVASKRAGISLNRAVRDIMSLGSWSFARRVLPPILWDGPSRTFTHSLTEVEDVWYDGRTIKYVDWQDHAHSNNTDGVPSCWTTVDYGTIRLAPYPTTIEQQALVRVVGYGYPDGMNSNNDTPGVPGTFVDALVSRATGAFLLRHTADSVLSNQFNNEFEVAIQSLRDRDRGSPRATGSMLFRPHI